MMRSPFVVIGLFLVTALLVLFLVWPSYQELTVIQEQTAFRTRELETQESYFDSLRSLEARLEPYATQLSAIESALPNDPSLPSLYDLLGDTAASSGLVMREITSSITPPSEGSGSRVSTTNVFLVLRGPYEGFKRFLLAVQQSWRIIGIQTISVSSQQQGALQFEVRLSAFSY